MPREPQLTPERARRDHRDMLVFLAINAAIGALIGLALTAAFIGFDLGGIGTRIGHSPDWALWIFLLAGPMALVFGASAAASAIWLMPYQRKFARPAEPEDKDDGIDHENPDRQSR